MRTSAALGTRTSMMQIRARKVATDFLEVKARADIKLETWHHGDVVLERSRLRARGEEDVITIDPVAKKVKMMRGADVEMQSLDGVDRSVQYADMAGWSLYTKDAAGVYTQRIGVEGGKDVADVKLSRSVQKIVPPSAGADALVVRSFDNTVDRVKIAEDGKITFAGGTLTGDLVPDVSGVRVIGAPGRLLNVLWVRYICSAVPLDIEARTGIGLSPGPHGIIFHRLTRFVLNSVRDVDFTEMALFPLRATSTVTLRNSPLTKLIGSYWDAVAEASKDRDAVLFHRMLSTAPTSEFAFQIAGADYLRVGDGGIVAHRDILPDADGVRNIGASGRGIRTLFLRPPVGTPLITCWDGVAERPLMVFDIAERLNIGMGATVGRVRLVGRLLEFYGLAGDAFAPVTPGRHAIGTSAVPWGEVWIGMKDWGDRIGGIFAVPHPATSTETIRSSPPSTMRAVYWDGTKSVPRDASIFHRMLSTAPASELAFQIAGADVLRLKDTGDLEIVRHPVIPASYNILGRSYAGTAKLVTETVWTLKDSCAPVSPKTVFYPLNCVVSYSNPATSGVTLDYEVRLLFSDGTEAVVFTRAGIAAGTSGTDDLLGETIAKAFKDGVSVVALRVYGRVSAAPPATLEPTITLASVKAFMF